MAIKHSNYYVCRSTVNLIMLQHWLISAWYLIMVNIASGCGMVVLSWITNRGRFCHLCIFLSTVIFSCHCFCFGKSMAAVEKLSVELDAEASAASPCCWRERTAQVFETASTGWYETIVSVPSTVSVMEPDWPLTAFLKPCKLANDSFLYDNSLFESATFTPFPSTSKILSFWLAKLRACCSISLKTSKFNPEASIPFRDKVLLSSESNTGTVNWACLSPDEAEVITLPRKTSLVFIALCNNL